MIPITRTAVGTLGAALVAVGALGCGRSPVAGLDTSELAEFAGFVRWGGVVVSLLIFAVALVALHLLRGTAARLGEQYGNHRPLIQRVESFARFAVYFVAAVLCLGLSFRIDHQVFLFVGGGVALAIGFALRDLVAALIAGVTILFNRPFQVGDRVRFGDTYGDVLRIGLHSVRLRTLDEIVVTIPNHKLLADVTASGTYGSLDMPVPMEFFIGIDQDAELATRLVTESLLTSRYVFLDEPVTTSLSQVLLPNGYAALRILGRAHVHDARYERAFETDVTKRVLRAFRKHRILPPAMLHRVVLDGGAQRAPRAEDPPG